MAVVVTRSESGWRVDGEIDAGSSAELSGAFEQLPRAGLGPLEIDLDGVSFIDSSGLRVLIDLSNRVHAEGGTVLIRKASLPVRHLLEITQLAELFGIDGPGAATPTPASG